jgi:hypothetical protein
MLKGVNGRHDHIGVVKVNRLENYSPVLNLGSSLVIKLYYDE